MHSILPYCNNSPSRSSTMQTIIIENPSDSDQRIDKFLKKYLPNITLSTLYKWLRTGKIKVNEKKVEQTYRLDLGDSIVLFINDEEISSLRQQETLIHTIQEKKIEILYEDPYFLAVNKPTGMNVHPGDHKTTEASLIELIQDQLWGRYDSLSFRPSLVHRIDRDTSGTLLIAKEKRTLDALLSLLQNGKIEKTYHAVVVGKPIKARDTLSANLERIENAKNEAKVIVSPWGQRAITHYATLREGIRERYSLLECQIETGRTHQIRVHMAHNHTPILGDKSYGNIPENTYARKHFSIHRQLLHAYSLSFIHPITREKIIITAPYAHDFKQLLGLDQ